MSAKSKREKNQAREAAVPDDTMGGMGDLWQVDVKLEKKKSKRVRKKETKEERENLPGLGRTD